MPLSSDHRWEDFRRQMPIAGKWAYFDHAAISPLPGPTHDAIAQWLLEASEKGGPAWPGWDHRLNDVHSIAAKMVGAAPMKWRVAQHHRRRVARGRGISVAPRRQRGAADRRVSHESISVDEPRIARRRSSPDRNERPPRFKSLGSGVRCTHPNGGAQLGGFLKRLASAI